jgi:hypothetical protein
LTNFGELECYEKVMKVNTKNNWEQGMKEEMDSLVNNQTWDLVQFPAGKKSLQSKWVYKLKEEDGGKKWYKVLDADPMRRKGYFWEEKHEGKKWQLEKKKHMREKHVRCTCKGDLIILGLGFLQCIVMVDEPRIVISSTSEV